MSMLAKERHRRILSRLEEAGSVRVAELARVLEVTEETIRRDLESLDGEGRLIRIHGGAVPIEDDGRELPFNIRQAANLDQKKAIARAAAGHIAEGDVIALDASSSANELARVIPDVPLTVVTNSLAAAGSLLKLKRVQIVCTGGILDAPSLSLVGSLAEKALEHFNINKLFFSSKGVDLTRGLSVAEDSHARLKRIMLDLSERSYLLADSSKFGVKSVVFFARMPEVDVVITDTAASAADVEKLEELGLKTLTAG
jgi:DeoR/GlpR family transcriptional regulator of sugar metabolism